MMETAPASSFVVAQSELLFQLFVIPLNDPAVQAYQITKLGAAPQSR